MAHSVVSPEILRFTQDSIKNTFKKPYEYQRIDDAVDQIGNNQLSPAVFMPLHVVQHKSVLWSLDNRRLWVLRKAGLPTVKVILVLPNYSRRSEEFFSSLSDPVVRRYSSANYFPRVRGGVRSVGIGKGTRDGALRPPIRIPHHPTAVADANNNTTPARIPHHLRTGTVRIDNPAKVIYEASSMCFDKQSQPMPHSNVCLNNLRFTQQSNVSTSGGAPSPPTPLLLHHPTNTTLPKSTSTVPSPSPFLSPSLCHLKDFTLKINIPPPTNSGAPLSAIPLPHHHPTILPSTTFSKYKPSPSPSPPPATYHVRDSTVRINIHPSVPPLRSTSHQLSQVTVPLLSNNDSVSGSSENKGSCLWAKLVNFVCWVKKKVFDFFGPITPAGNQGNYNTSV